MDYNANEQLTLTMELKLAAAQEAALAESIQHQKDTVRDAKYPSNNGKVEVNIKGFGHGYFLRPLKH